MNFMKCIPVVIAGLALAGCEVNLNSEGIVSRETKRFTVTGTPDVQLDTFEGSIEVHSWDRNEVEVEIEKRAMEQARVDEMQVTAEQQGNRIVIKVTRPRGDDDSDAIQIGVHFSPTARLRVALPRNSQLTASSNDGPISIEDVVGKLTLRTNDGSVRGSRIGGEILVRSGDGSIRFDRAEGKIDLETADGSITLEGKPAALRARTSDGAIRVELEPDTVMTDDWDLQTTDGSVVLTLPASFNALVDAETRDGVVRASHPSLRAEDRDDENREERRERRRVLRTAFGTGGKTLRLRAMDGSIRIE